MNADLAEVERLTRELASLRTESAQTIAGLEAEVERLSDVLADWKTLLTRRTENLTARATAAEARLMEMRALAQDGWKRVARAERKMNKLLVRLSNRIDEYDESEVSSITEGLDDPDVQALLEGSDAD